MIVNVIILQIMSIVALTMQDEIQVIINIDCLILQDRVHYDDHVSLETPNFARGLYDFVSSVVGAYDITTQQTATILGTFPEG